MLTIEARAFEEFVNLYFQGKFPHLRAGQAFYNHFQLQKMHSNKNVWDKIYNAEHVIAAMDLIKANVILH